MEQAVDLLLMVVVLLGLAALGTGKVVGCVGIVAVQGVVLGVLVILADVDHVTPHLVFLAALSIALKGVGIPWLLLRSIREAKVQRDVEPYVSFTLSLALGAVATGGAFWLSGLLELPVADVPQLVVPVSLATSFMGLLLLVTRRIAITQVLGYLVLENGIFVFSLALVEALPTLVEMGMLLDIFAGVFVMGITIYEINREFQHIDASKLHELQDRMERRRWPFGLRTTRAGSRGRQVHL